MKHLDKYGQELAVGDTVAYGDRIGTILILEDWSVLGKAEPGVYVSDVGFWGDCVAVAASRVVAVKPLDTVLNEDGEEGWAYLHNGQLRCPDCTSIHEVEWSHGEADYSLIPLRGDENCTDCNVVLMDDPASPPR